MNVDDKPRKYNLYHIVSESIEKEKMPSKLYYDMLVNIMGKIGENQDGEKTDNND